MSEDLYAYMDGTPAGVLNQNDSGRLSFTYLPDYLAARNATPLAPCLPLRSVTLSQFHAGRDPCTSSIARLFFTS